MQTKKREQAPKYLFNVGIFFPFGLVAAIYTIKTIQMAPFMLFRPQPWFDEASKHQVIHKLAAPF